MACVGVHVSKWLKGELAWATDKRLQFINNISMFSDNRTKSSNDFDWVKILVNAWHWIHHFSVFPHHNLHCIVSIIIIIIINIHLILKLISIHNYSSDFKIPALDTKCILKYYTLLVHLVWNTIDNVCLHCNHYRKECLTLKHASTLWILNLWKCIKHIMKECML